MNNYNKFGNWSIAQKMGSSDSEVPKKCMGRQKPVRGEILGPPQMPLSVRVSVCMIFHSRSC